MEEALVIQAARFGDLLQTRRLIQTMARDYKTHLAADQSFAPLVTRLYPEAFFHPVIFHGKLSPANCQKNADTFARLKSIPFKKIVNCNFSPLTAALTRLFDAKLVSGYRAAHISKGGQTASHWVRLGFRVSGFRAASPLNLADFWAWFTRSPVSPCSVNPAAKRGGRGLGIAVAGREKRRSLDSGTLASAAKTAFQILGKPEIRLFGTESEKGHARKLSHMFTTEMRAKTIDLCGKTDWVELITEMTGLDLLLTPDTGLMHLGAFLGVPVVAFFLSSAWCHETGPYGAGHLIFQSVSACSPCLESAPCPNGLICHKPFAAAGFQRFFARALTGAKNLEAPEGMQLWLSGYDSFGSLPKLLAGVDAHSELRAAERSILEDKAGLCNTWDPVTEVYKNTLEKLEPISEWMLPPWRYC